MDIKLCSEADSYCVLFLVQGKYRCKITYRTHDTNSCPKKFNVGSLIECRIIIFYQQKLGKEFERTEKEGVVKS
jgi:hypothetical protein